jgi:methyl-accepting chemotaxis protein
MGIKQKFFCLVGVVGIILTVISGVGYYIAYSHLLTSIENEIQANVKEEGLRLDAWLQEKASLATGASRQMHNLSGTVVDSREILSLVDGVPGIMDLSHGTESGSFMSWSDGDLSQEADPRTRPWYKEAKAAGKTVFTEVYKNVGGENDGKLVVSAAAPYNDKNGAFRGAVCEDIMLDELDKFVDSIKYHNEGQGIVIDKTGSIIATAGNEPVMSKLSDDPGLKDKEKELKDQSEGYFTVTRDGQKQIFAYVTLEDVGWTVGIFVPEDFVFADMKTMKITYSLLVLVGILLVAFAGIKFSQRITGVILRLRNHADELAKGNLQLEDMVVESGDELGALTKSFNVMRYNIHGLVCKIVSTAEQMAASSEELTASAEQSAQASNQVAGSVARVAEGTEAQLRLTEHADNTVQQISKAITQVASNTEIVSAAAEKTTETANAGEEAIKKAVMQMKTIEEKTNATSAVIGELEERSQRIGHIVDVISNISGQTNLLALNAAVEAARAGEAGRGFAVVAEEVRKLAEQSQQAAKQITELIDEVQEKTNSAVAFMEDGKQEVDHGAEVVSSAGESFGEILDMVRDMTKQVYEISASIEEITGGTQKVVDAVQNIDQEGRKATEQTQTISASTEEQSASIEEIASASHHLAGMAEDLQKAIRQFKV